MPARRLPSIPAPTTVQEALEATKTCSVVDQFSSRGSSLITKRHFLDRHHTLGDAGLIGGDCYGLSAVRFVVHQ
jgi:magnesium chelatase family protein